MSSKFKTQISFDAVCVSLEYQYILSAVGIVQKILKQAERMVHGKQIPHRRFQQSTPVRPDSRFAANRKQLRLE